MPSAVLETNAETPYQPNLYSEVFSSELNNEIESLWGNILLTKWPDRIVTEPFPHRSLFDEFSKTCHHSSFRCTKVESQTTQPYYRKELAELAIKYVQLEEALGRPPEMKETGEKFLYRSNVLSADEGEAWRIYSDAVQNARNATK